MMPFSMPGKMQKGLFFPPVSPNLGRITRPMNPISLASTPQNSTSAPLFRCPEPPFPHTPNHLLGCPISPFGVSHFAIWGIPFHLLGYIFGTFAHNVQPRCPIWLLRFRSKSMCVFFSVQENRPAYPTAKIFILYMAKERKSFYIFVQ